MKDMLVKDLVPIISRLELLHGELRREYEEAEEEYALIEKRYLEAKANRDTANRNYFAAHNALMKLDGIRDRMTNPDKAEEEQDWF